MGLCNTWAFCLRKAPQGSDVAILVSWWQPPLKTSTIIPLRVENPEAQVSQATCPRSHRWLVMAQLRSEPELSNYKASALSTKPTAAGMVPGVLTHV